MKPIKFRAKALGTGALLYFDLFCLSTKDGILYANAIGIDLDTVQEYTGLKDKNGKEIYEGDILESPSELRIIVWKEEHCGFGHETILKHRDGTRTVMEGAQTPYPTEYSKCGVIGNIWENKELLNDN